MVYNKFDTTGVYEIFRMHNVKIFLISPNQIHEEYMPSTNIYLKYLDP